MGDINEILRGRFAKPAAIALASAALLLAVKTAWAALGPSRASSCSRERAFVCSETGEPFEYQIKIGDRVPVVSPHSGRNTGYPAELCYWTADGHAKEQPTLVLLNRHLGRPGPTFCPDCNRLVVALNPAPEPGRKPPLTKAQHMAKQPIPLEER